jgi:oligopeptide/dipeptide ABC transporter ATP-binding protein
MSDAVAPVLEVRGLHVTIAARTGDVVPLQGVDLTVPAGSRVALVGESGSGKSLTAAAVLGMLPDEAHVDAGSVALEGEEILGLSERRMRSIRGTRIAIMFQNPRASLNPVLTIGGQIAEVIRIHEGIGRRESRDRAISLLDQMGIPDARRRADDYVHQYSGGMAQRAALAMALSCRPSLLIADEPTSGLDATLQQQVLDLVIEQVETLGTALLLITHDIGLVAQTCERAVVMYAGRVMEAGSVAEVVHDPRNPYTQELVRAFRQVGPGRMSSIPGTVPTLVGRLEGCGFAARCPIVEDGCRSAVPPLRPIEGREVACVKA